MSYNNYHSSRPSAFGGSGGRSRRPSYPSNSRGNRSGGGNRRKSQYIDPARLVKVAKMAEVEQYESKHQFSDFDINQLLKTNLSSKGFVTPSPIQDQAIPLSLAGKDIIGIANTGTGKTAAFAVPILHGLMERQNSRALIIAPTRELAQQIEEEFKSIGRGARISSVLLIGGKNMGWQLRDLRNNPRIVIGTPGRIKDHIERNSLDLSRFNIVVLDEVDRMLDMGFVQDVKSILSRIGHPRQSLFFSATMDHKVGSLIETFSNDPITVEVKTGATSENVNQDIVKYRGTGEKMEKLSEILKKDHVEKIIVFDETQRNVEKLSKELQARGFSVDAIHGGKSQGQRQRALKRFKDNEVTILVATDVAARGIDVVDITHVINYSMPQTYDDYVHRIGRTGRAGRVGHALTFVN